MFETLLRLYKEGKLTEQGLDNAVAKGWITEMERKEIVGETDGNPT